MGTKVRTYDPAKIVVSVAGQIITGFAPGRFLEIIQDREQVADDVGVDGEPVRWAADWPLVTLSMTLALTAAANYTLGNLYNVDRLTMAAIFPVLIEDQSTGESTGRLPRMVASRGWIQTQPTWAYEGGTPVGRQWKVRMLDTIFDHGLTSETELVLI